MKKNENMIRLTAVLLLCLCMLMAEGVEIADADVKEVSVVTVWKAPESDKVPGALDFSQASRAVQLERKGFERAVSEYTGDVSIREHIVSENLDLTRFTTTLADLYNEEDILMTVGASTDLYTMYTEMETNFFNISTLIPFSDMYDNYDGAQNYSVRMTPDTSSYVNFIGNDVLRSDWFQLINAYLFPNVQTPEYSINVVVVFDDNANGHHNAVKITQQIMANGYTILHYMPYSSAGDLTTFQSQWTAEIDAPNEIDVVLILCEDRNMMKLLDFILGSFQNQSAPPVILAIEYAPNESSEDVLFADNFFIIQQAMDFSQCPSGIVSSREAMGYAAGTIMIRALERAAQRQGSEPAGISLWFRSSEQRQMLHQNFINSFRNNVHSRLLEMSEYIPCYGMIRLSSTLDINVELELARFVGLDRTGRADSSEIYQLLRNRIAYRYGISNVYNQ